MPPVDVPLVDVPWADMSYRTGEPSRGYIRVDSCRGNRSVQSRGSSSVFGRGFSADVGVSAGGAACDEPGLAAWATVGSGCLVSSRLGPAGGGWAGPFPPWLVDAGADGGRVDFSSDGGSTARERPERDRNGLRDDRRRSLAAGRLWGACSRGVLLAIVTGWPHFGHEWNWAMHCWHNGVPHS